MSLFPIIFNFQLSPTLQIYQLSIFNSPNLQLCTLLNIWFSQVSLSALTPWLTQHAFPCEHTLLHSPCFSSSIYLQCSQPVNSNFLNSPVLSALQCSQPSSFLDLLISSFRNSFNIIILSTLQFSRLLNSPTFWNLQFSELSIFLNSNILGVSTLQLSHIFNSPNSAVGLSCCPRFAAFLKNK